MSTYPTTFYRVSVKAIIRDEAGLILLCKENQPHWSLPGGGIDHNETPLAALARELQEELGIIDITHTKLSSVRPFYAPRLDTWLMWVVYEVELGSYTIRPGTGVTEATFMDVETLRHSDNLSEQLAYASVQEANQR